MPKKFTSRLLKFQPFNSIRQWLASVEICNYKTAHLLCQIIPARCPFEREIKYFDRTLFYVPPLCKLNPFYNELVALRFKSLNYLVEQWNEDITLYC